MTNIRYAKKLIRLAKLLLANDDPMYQHANGRCGHTMPLSDWEKVKHAAPQEIDDDLWGQMHQCPKCKSHIMRCLPPNENNPDAHLKPV